MPIEPVSHRLRLACVVLGLLVAPRSASADAPVIVSGLVGAPDSSCNIDINPGWFVVAEGTVTEIRLIVPPGTALSGWQCVADVCARQYRTQDLGEDGYRVETLKLVDPDPTRTAGGTIVIVGGSAEVEIPECIDICLPTDIGGEVCYNFCDLSAPVCCACPCDFATCD